MKYLYSLILLFVTVLPLSAQEDYYLVDDSNEIPDSLKEFIPKFWPETLTDRLNQIVNTSAVLKSSQYGIVVYDLTTETMLFKKNESSRFRPASTMKVFTSTAALSALGKSHRFVTKIGHTGVPRFNEYRIPQYKEEVVQDSDSVYTRRIELDPKIIRSRTLHGNICVKGSMDPMFSESDVRHFAEAVRELNVDSIYGSLVLDLSLKDTVRMGEGWCWDDPNPILTPLLVDKKDVFASHFLKYIKQYGIVITGSTVKGEYPINTTDIGESSHSLYEVLNRTLKNSDNTFAECIFYKLGAETSHQSGVSAKNAKEAIHRLITRVGRNPDDYYIADGSGLSHYNSLSPEVELDVLRYAFRRSHIFDTLYEKVPVAGVDGTLGSRMKGTNAHYNVHAKTGTLSGVSTLAGYCKAPNGHWIAFVIMNNGLKASTQGRSFQDVFCNALCTVE